MTGDGAPVAGVERLLWDGLDALARETTDRLPVGVKRRLVGPYNRLQERRADRTFRARPHPVQWTAADAPRHLVLVVVDALRADAVDPDVSPFLADRDVGAAVTAAPWTFPAVTSLLTGRYPHEHGAMRQSDAADRGATDLVVPPALPDDEATLPDVLAGAGYQTYGGFAFHMPFFALAGRFERHALYDTADAGTVLADAGDWLAAAAADGPTFSYLHLADLHEPLRPPDAYARDFDVDLTIPNLRRWDYLEPGADGPAAERYRRHRRRLYDAALAYVDDCLLAFHARLADRLDDDLVLVVTADHGEAFGEFTGFDAERFVDSRPAYGVDHGGTPYESLARVPLAVEGLDVAPFDEVRAPASSVDVTPTLLESVGLTGALPTSGQPLSSAPPADRIPLVEAARYGHEKKAAYLDGWKLVVSRGDDRTVAFRLPEEEPSWLPESVERRLVEALPPWPDAASHPVRLSAIARNRLEETGYV